MSDLVTAVNELIKGKRVEENLHTYTEGLSALYRRLACLRFAMNYFTFAEVYRELDINEKRIIDSSVDEIQKLVNEIVILNVHSENVNGKIDSFRNKLIAKMEVLTGYTDRFQILEYMLNRVEYRFSDSGFGDDYYNDKFENDIYRYITADKDNSVINMKLSQVISQVPMRLSKNKFYDILKESFSIYKGSEKQSVDDFAYMVRTSGLLYMPGNFFDEFPELKALYDETCGMDVENITKDEYEKYKKNVDKASALIEQYADFFVMITEVLNDVYSISLNFSALTDINEDGELTSIINDSYDMIEGHDIDPEKVSLRFVEFEGLQEKLTSRIFNPESALEEIISINEKEIAELDYMPKLEALRITSKLQSASTFARLDDSDIKKDEADEDYINEVVETLVNEFSALFETMDRYKKRAVMALVISNLPAFYNNFDEFKKYVHVALSQCTDRAERQACMVLINQMITSE